MIRSAMACTVRTPIKSSSLIVIPNSFSAASIITGRRLERMARSDLMSISGSISSLSYPVASMMIRMTRSV